MHLAGRFELIWIKLSNEVADRVLTKERRGIRLGCSFEHNVVRNGCHVHVPGKDAQADQVVQLMRDKPRQARQVVLVGLPKLADEARLRPIDGACVPALIAIGSRRVGQRQPARYRFNGQPCVESIETG